MPKTKDRGKIALMRCLDDRFEAGKPIRSLTEFAREIGVSKQAVSAWSRIPAEHCVTIEKMLGLKRYDLRPDVFPRPVLRAKKGSQNGTGSR